MMLFVMRSLVVLTRDGFVASSHRRILIELKGEKRAVSRRSSIRERATYSCLTVRCERLHFALKLRRALLEDAEILVGQLFQDIWRHGLVHVAVPYFALT